jgi:glycerol dehydrogenase-like iron-containing ADH family enzyme
MWDIKKPSDRVIAPYEEMKTAFTRRLNAQITNELANIKENKDEENSNQEELNPKSLQPLIWEVAQKGYKNLSEIAERISLINGEKVYEHAVKNQLKKMRKKGFDIKQFKLTLDREAIAKKMAMMREKIDFSGFKRAKSEGA